MSKQEQKSVTFEFINVLRYPMMVFVVVHHCFFTIEGWHWDQLPTQSLGSNVVAEALLFSRLLFSSLIQFFYLISGYLFFIHLDDWDFKVWKRKMMRRVRSLLIPYLLWNTLYILYLIGPELADCLFHGQSYESIVAWISAHGGLRGLYWDGRVFNPEAVDMWGNPASSRNPILLPFYYIRNLLVLSILTPLFYCLLHSRGKRYAPLAVATIGILAFLFVTKTSFVLSGFSSEGFFFFGLGAFFSLNGIDLSEFFYAKRKLIGIVTCCLLMVELHYGFLLSDEGRSLHPFYMLFELMTVLNCTSWLLKRSNGNRLFAFLRHALTRWQGTSFMIYALHAFLILDVTYFVNQLCVVLTGFYSMRMMEVATSYPCLVLLLFALKVFLVVSLCMLASILLQKFLPRLHQVLCGR